MTIAVVHPDFSYRGGGEAVALNIVRAIQSEFPDKNVIIFTQTEPDLSGLSEYFNIPVNTEHIDVEVINTPWPDVLSNHLLHLQRAVFQRAVHRALSAEFDAVISTQNEIHTPTETIQYIHRPQPPFLKGADGVVESVYSAVCHVVSGFGGSKIQRDQLIANSRYTSEAVEMVYNVTPDVVHPPVDSSGFEPVPWDEQQNGFVAVGRVAPEKKVLESIKTIHRVREKGHDVHLHIVGPEGEDKRYNQKVRQRADELEFVSIEGPLSHSDGELAEIIQEHRFLISHCVESFGISIAESVSARTIPFVNNIGGQTEIVNSDSLSFSDQDDAVSKITSVLSNQTRQDQIQNNLPQVEYEFGQKRFQDEIKSHLQSVVPQPNSASTQT